jgi:hypothetical protein
MAQPPLLMDVAGVIGTQPMIFIRVHPLSRLGIPAFMEKPPPIKSYPVEDGKAAKSAQKS